MRIVEIQLGALRKRLVVMPYELLTRMPEGQQPLYPEGQLTDEPTAKFITDLLVSLSASRSAAWPSIRIRKVFMRVTSGVAAWA